MPPPDRPSAIAPSRRVALLQSSYIPWKGYFDIIRAVDPFIFFDDVQFTSRDWRSRNRIKTAAGPLWLTVPVGSAIHRRICDVPLPELGWERRHLRSIVQSYARAPYLKRWLGLLEWIYLEHRCASLSEFNQRATRALAQEALGIRTEFRDSREFEGSGSKLDRLLDVLQRAGASDYLSGPAARDYIDAARFEQLGIGLAYQDYAGYPDYGQPHPPFDHQVSVIDLLLTEGPRAPWYIWGWRSSPSPD